MNIVFIMGKVVTNVEYNFIYDKYKINNCNEKYKHTSIAKVKIETLNKSIINIYGYDNIADDMDRNLKCNSYVMVMGKIDSNMEINVEKITILFERTIS